MNLAGIIGPALGGLLIPLFGVSTVFAMNALAFVLVLLAVITWKRKSVALDTPLEGFLDSLAGAVRYMRYAPGVRIVLLRNGIFGVLIGAIPALLPVVSLKVLHLDSVYLGLVFTCMGVGSLAGAILILEPARRRLKPNQMTVLAGIVLAVSYALMAVVRQPQVFLIVAALAGAAWTISASELWIAGQRVIPDWIRGRRLSAWVLRFCFYFPASSAYLALKLLVVSFLNLLLFHGFSLIYFELPCPPNRGGSDLCGPANTDHRLIFANRALTCSD
jgi:hypothetical protein